MSIVSILWSDCCTSCPWWPSSSCTSHRVCTSRTTSCGSVPVYLGRWMLLHAKHTLLLFYSPMSLMSMTLVLAGMCWVKHGFWSSPNRSSDWLEDSALAAVEEISNRWNQPSAPTATTRFYHREHSSQNHQSAISRRAKRVFHVTWTYLAFIAQVSYSHTR